MAIFNCEVCGFDISQPFERRVMNTQEGEKMLCLQCAAAYIRCPKCGSLKTEITGNDNQRDGSEWIKCKQCGSLSPNDVGMKFDFDKDRWDLMQWDFLTEICKVVTFGAKKYDADNWKKVEGARWRYFGATCRHVTAWWLGERNDQESGLHHLAHACCCIMFLFGLEREGEK